MFFIILGNFLVLNLFVGVVVSTFNREQQILGKNFLLTENQKKWLEQKNLCMNIQPRVVIDENISACRAFIYKIVTSKNFEVFILSCIGLNTIALAITWYSQPVAVDDILDYINYSFAIIFAIESFLKLFALGCRAYFRDSGNAFDFMIVITSIISTSISIQMHADFGSSTTFIRAMRMSRVFKYIKQAKQIKIIFETVIVVIPALTNIGGLLLLFLYIFSVLGVFLFAGVKL